MGSISSKNKVRVWDLCYVRGLVILLVIFYPFLSLALKIPDPELAGKTNPHWTGRSCLECHEKKPVKGKPADIKFGGDIDRMCMSCHKTRQLVAGEHAVGITLKEGAHIRKPPSDFPLPNGRISCITCHDARLQEAANKTANSANPSFLRRYPYEMVKTFEWAKSEMDERYQQDRYGICLFCHVQGAVLQFSPHKNQIKPNGEINAELCLMCHTEVPDREAIDRKDWKIIGRLQDQCKNCHMGKTRYHPIRVTHYGNNPPQKIRNQIKSAERKLGVLIPYDNDAKGEGRLVCPSCHNPHQRGVQKNPVTAKGADVHQKLKVEGFGMCLACHGTSPGMPQMGAPF